MVKIGNNPVETFIKYEYYFAKSGIREICFTTALIPDIDVL